MLRIITAAIDRQPLPAKASTVIQVTASSHASVGAESVSPQAALQDLIEHAAHYLPAQGPINVFIHHNTLHAFEELPFDEAVQTGGRIYGCQPYLTEDQYRLRLANERIQVADLKAVLADDLGERGSELIANLVTRYDLRRAMLEHPLRVAAPAELRWFVAETDALTRFRPEVAPNVATRLLDETRHWLMRDLLPRAQAQSGQPAAGESNLLAGLISESSPAALDRMSPQQWEALTLRLLWRVCRQGVHGVKPHTPPTPPARRHRDLLLDITGSDTDQWINDILIRFCSAFLDQGLSQWSLPARDAGFFRCFAKLYCDTANSPLGWLRHLPGELARIREAGLTPLDSILESLALLGVPHDEHETYVNSTLLALRGWAGMIRQMEMRADRAAYPIPPGTLAEYLAVRLLLERLAVAHLARAELDFRGELRELRSTLHQLMQAREQENTEQRAFPIFQLAQVLGLLPSDLYKLSKHDWSWLLAEIESFPGIERRRLFHAAFERRYRTQVLDAIGLHAARRFQRVEKPRFQVICCLDEREESFRRHLEEVAPDVESFGVAGFFAVAMNYRGAGDAHFVPLCPVVVRPQHWVAETAVYSLDETDRRRARTRRLLGAVSHRLHHGSRTIARGALLTAGLGALASIPLVARVLFPRMTSRIRRTASKWVQPPSITQLDLERNGTEPAPTEGHFGYTLDEMANIGERMLRDIGLTTSLARVVIAFGHGSNSLNNPHKSAYDCGACGGNAGGPNARAIARMLNDPRVRHLLKQRGLVIPTETWFVGALHNTCSDEITYYDLDRLPPSHRKEFDEIDDQVQEACERNAHERARRFVSAPLTLSFKAAKRHVEGRAEDLAQTRPECGHASNAVCFVGRRSRVRGLFMDRRTFLTSYDPTEDSPDHAILTRILQAAVPVCAGINLEYYFSYVDPAGYGCGTKLPHNVASLLGVMDGAASDLRTGLPWQMVEIHEPVRLLCVIETTPAAFEEIMAANEGIGRVCRNGWVQVATLSPTDDAIHVLRDGRFERYAFTAKQLPQVAASVDWYRGWRDNLGFAQVIG